MQNVPAFQSVRSRSKRASCQRTSFFIAEVTERLSKTDMLLYHPLEIGEESSWFPWSVFAEAKAPSGSRTQWILPPSRITTLPPSLTLRWYEERSMFSVTPAAMVRVTF